MQKLKTYLSTKQGSVLVYSLIILATMLFIVTSISVVSITEKKSASSTDASMQAYQTADSGFQLALKEINKGVAANQKLSDLFSCDPSGAVLNIPGAGPANATYSLTFQKASGPVTDCTTTLANEVVSIKSIGSYKETVRAVEVAMAAGGVPAGTLCGAANYNTSNGWSSTTMLCQGKNPGSECPSGYTQSVLYQNGGVDQEYFCVKN